MKNILTIDVEDWYHALLSQQKYIKAGQHFEERIVDSMNRLLDIIKEKGERATFFVVGELVNKYPKMIQRIANDGHEIGVHSYSHKRVCEMTPEEFREDLRKSKVAIYRSISRNPLSYRAPMFSIKKTMLWVFKILSEEGFKYDSSMFPTINPLYGDIKVSRYPFFIEEVDVDIKEFPLTTLSLMGLPLPVAGGFYLRLLPVSVIAFSIECCNKKGIPFVLYTHPWEIDQGQPRPTGITIREGITHYYNRDRALKKIEYLFDKYEFTSIAEFEGVKM